MTGKYITFARVSSEEQEREGFSLDIQEDAFQEWLQKNGGTVSKAYKVTETAHKPEQRKKFNEMILYAKKNAKHFDGILFYKIDRICRNMSDWAEFLKLRDDYGLKLICITEPFENTAAGRLSSTMMAAFAEFFSDQLSERTKSGVNRRVQDGLFPGHAPYGYKNVCHDKRNLIEIDDIAKDNVNYIFMQYAHGNHTLDSLKQHLESNGFIYRKNQPEWTRSKLHKILTDQSYIGKIMHRGEWHTGTHPSIVDTKTFKRVQKLIGTSSYNAHSSTYGGGKIICGYCNKPITAEVKKKQTKAGIKEYHYYRCSRYNSKGHPKVRLNENKLDEQMMALFDRLNIEDEKVRKFIATIIRERAKNTHSEQLKHAKKIQKQILTIKKQMDRLLTMRTLEEINGETYAKKNAEFKRQLSELEVQGQGVNRQHIETNELAEKVFELSQSLKNKWVTSDIPEKRMILEILCLNYTLEDVTLCYQLRKPFHIIAEGLKLKFGSGDRI